MEEMTGFEYVHLAEVDPSFTPLPADYYNLKILSAELFEGVSGPNAKNPGAKYQKVNFQFGVTDHPKFSGRRVFERNLFYNDFTLRILRRIQDATGIVEKDGIPEWLKTLSRIQPTVKLQVVVEPDVNFDGTPNPKNLKGDGSPGDRSVINWKSGVQPTS